MTENLGKIIRATETDLHALCEEYSDHLYIRRYFKYDENGEKIYAESKWSDNSFGNGEDIKRACTEEERNILSNLMYAVLLTLRSDYKDIQTALDVAEFSADLMIPHLNGYMSIYNPLREILSRLENGQCECA